MSFNIISSRTFTDNYSIHIKSNSDVIQHCQNIAFRTITAAYRFAIHRDMMLPTIADEIQRFARKH